MKARRMRRRLFNVFAFAFLAFALYLIAFTKPDSTPPSFPMKAIKGTNGATASLHKAH